jgi:hypothetical protein
MAIPGRDTLLSNSKKTRQHSTEIWINCTPIFYPVQNVRFIVGEMRLQPLLYNLYISSMSEANLATTFQVCAVASLCSALGQTPVTSTGN